MSVSSESLRQLSTAGNPLTRSVSEFQRRTYLDRLYEGKLGSLVLLLCPSSEIRSKVRRQVEATVPNLVESEVGDSRLHTDLLNSENRLVEFDEPLEALRFSREMKLRYPGLPLVLVEAGSALLQCYDRVPSANEWKSVLKPLSLELSAQPYCISVLSARGSEEEDLQSLRLSNVKRALSRALKSSKSAGQLLAAELLSESHLAADSSDSLWTELLEPARRVGLKLVESRQADSEQIRRFLIPSSEHQLELFESLVDDENWEIIRQSSSSMSQAVRTESGFVFEIDFLCCVEDESSRLSFEFPLSQHFELRLKQSGPVGLAASEFRLAQLLSSGEQLVDLAVSLTDEGIDYELLLSTIEQQYYSAALDGKRLPRFCDSISEISPCLDQTGITLPALRRLFTERMLAEHEQSRKRVERVFTQAPLEWTADVAKRAVLAQSWLENLDVLERHMYETNSDEENWKRSPAALVGGFELIEAIDRLRAQIMRFCAYCLA